VGILDLNGDGNLEIAVATCGGATFNVLNVEGDILWTLPTRHAQHMIVGNFRPDTETKELGLIAERTEASKARTGLLYTPTMAKSNGVRSVPMKVPNAG